MLVGSYKEQGNESRPTNETLKKKYFDRLLRVVDIISSRLC